MEFREYYKILKSNISTVIYAILIFVVAAYAWSVKKSETFSASLLLNISRMETQSTTNYKYDQFYRLQADEEFTDTIVGWLKAPGVTQDIFAKADIKTEEKSLRQLSKSFRSEKLSPELVEVYFSTQTEDEAKKIGNAINLIISDKVKSLNIDASDPNWFRVDESNFIVVKNIQDLRINLGIAVLVGIFIGILLAFGKHYISEER